MKTRFSRFVLGVVWLLAIGVGVAAVMRYETATGPVGLTPGVWPKDANIVLDSQRPTLVMFAHPKCPCTRAALGELNRLLARCVTRPAVHIFFLKPEGAAADWMKTDLWQRAGEIPGLDLHEDLGGRVAQRFGAETSGQVLLYDPAGKLLFQGGITAARGQAGDNAGESVILDLLARPEVAACKTTSVFGCALQNPAARPAN